MDYALHAALTNPDSVMGKIETEWRLLAMKVHDRLKGMTDIQQLNYMEEWTTWISMPNEAPEYQFLRNDNAVTLGEDIDDDDDDAPGPPTSLRRATMPTPTAKPGPKSAKKGKAEGPQPSGSAIPKRLKPGGSERTPLKNRTRKGREPWK